MIIKRMMTKRMFSINRIQCIVAENTEGYIKFSAKLLDDIWQAVEEFPYEFIIILQLSQNNLELTRKVVGFYVPEQIVSHTSAEMTEFTAVHAVMHSHNKMQAFHSTIDEDGVDNAVLSLVFSSPITGRETTGKLAFRLPCGEIGVTNKVSIGTEDKEGIMTIPQETTIYKSKCPFANENSEKLPCGIRIRRNHLLEEIKRKTKVRIEPKIDPRIDPKIDNDYFRRWQDD
jgi:hypothetical protein